MYSYRSFNNSTELMDCLNGAVTGNPLPTKVTGLHGLTLVINDGSADRTVIFADATGAGLSPAAILAQVRAAHANLSVVQMKTYGHVKEPQLVLATIGYSSKAGTANALLGWPAGTTVVTEIPTENISLLSALNASNYMYTLITHVDALTLLWSRVVGGDRSIGDTSTTITSDWMLIRDENLSIQLSWTGTTAGTITFQTSNDASTVVSTISVSDFSPAMSNPAGAAGSTGGQMVTQFKYFRVVFTRSGGTGTMTGSLEEKE